MAIAFIENNKRLGFDILGYEFPKIGRYDDDYDANWLKVYIEYSDGNRSFQQTGCYLLSFELKELIDKTDEIISGKETGLIAEILEPYLSFAVTSTNDTYTVLIKYIYSASPWKNVYICQSMSLEELTALNSLLKELYERFPYRETGAYPQLK